MEDDSSRDLARGLAAAFGRRFGGCPDVVVRAPGRVNLLGAHVDYNEGQVLPAAIERSLWLAAASSGDPVLRVASLAFNDERSLDLATLPGPLAERADAGLSWLDYVAGVAWTLQACGRPTGGLEILIGGDLPAGAGISSSAALEVALLMVFERTQGFALAGLERAQLGRQVENGYLGVQSGLMDQFACVHGRAGHAVCLDCRTLDFERIQVSDDVAVVVADTHVRRRLVNSSFNARRDECGAAVELLRPLVPGLRTLRDLRPEDLELHTPDLPPALVRRARHVVEECARVRDGAEALRSGDLATFGDAMRRSHLSSRDLYEVSVPELDTLATAAWEVAGCFGARLTGAGFGGCVTALAEREAVPELCRHLSARFEARHGCAPGLLVSPLADGAAFVEL